VIATNGDTHLGGDDIDNLLIAIALDDIAGDTGNRSAPQPEAIQAIRKAVIEAKIALSSQSVAQMDIKLPQGGRYRRELTREQFEQLIQPVIARTIAPCRDALRDAHLVGRSDRRGRAGGRFNPNTRGAAAGQRCL
jgi:molecular chaperone DnaK (HSP70)